jgi:Ca2+/Na+ antiporter
MLVWLARSVWYVLGPLLVVPIAVVLAMGDYTFLTRYIWRAALLALTVQLVSRALLRVREHEADLRSTGHGLGPSLLMAVLGGFEAGSQPTRRWRQWLATHPSPQERLRVLDRPERVAGVGFVDGFVAAFLAAFALPLVRSVFYVSLAAVNLSEHVSLLSSAVGGLLLAFGVGLGLWRAALVRRLVCEPVRPAPAALGVAVGLVVGQSASLGGVGRETIVGIDQPVWVLLAAAVLGIGVTALSASLGELWADAAATAGGPRRSWLLALSANFVLFWAFLVVLSLQDAGRLGWDLTRAWLVSGMSTLPLLGALATVVAVVVWGLVAGRRARSAPAWLVDEPTEPAWPVGVQFNAGLPAVAGVAGGAMTTLSIVAFRLVSGPALDEAAQSERFYTYIWVVAAVGMAVTLLFAALVPRRGIAVGTVAGLSATLTGIVGLVAFNTALGGDLNVSFVLHLARPAAALGFVLMLAAAPAGLYAWQRLPATAVTPVRPTVWRAAAVALLVAAAVFAGRGYLIGAPEPAGEFIPGAAELDNDAHDYIWRVEPLLFAHLMQLFDEIDHIDGDVGASRVTRGARYRADVLPQLAELIAVAVEVTPPEGDARAAHSILLDMLSETQAGLDAYARWLETDDALAYRDFARGAVRTKALEAAYAEAVASMVEGSRTTLPSVR